MRKIIISALMIGAYCFNENTLAVNPPIIITAPSLSKSPLVAYYEIGEAESILPENLTGKEVVVDVNIHEQRKTEEALTSIANVTKELRCLSVDCELIDAQIIDIIIQILRGNQFLDAIDLKSSYGCLVKADYVRLYEELMVHPSLYQVDVNISEVHPAFYEIFTKKLDESVEHKCKILGLKAEFEYIQMASFNTGTFKLEVEDDANDARADELYAEFTSEQNKILDLVRQMKKEIALTEEL